MKYSVIIPVLNEKENLKELLPRLFSPDCEVIICDNGSADGTQRLVEDAIPNFRIKLSKGTGTVVDAILRGINLASSDKVIIMDGDCSHSPEIVPLMAKVLEEVDMVVGSRYCKGGSSRDSVFNRFISSGFNLLCIGVAPELKDRVSGFWGIRKSLTGVSIRNTRKPMLEYLVRGNLKSVREIPYTFVPRISGESKLGRGLSTILSELYSLILLYIHRFQKPLKFCIVGGAGIGINLGLLALLTEVGHVWYILSSFLAILVATAWNYVLNCKWTFKQKGFL